VTTPDPAPKDQARRRQRQKAVGASRPGVAAPLGPVDPRVIPLLDLIAEHIAHHIVADLSVPCQEETSEAFPSSAASLPGGAQPGIPGPSPTVPADLHEESHPNPTEPRRRTRRRAKGDKEFQHGSD
jgi:hypothetical protein